MGLSRIRRASLGTSGGGLSCELYASPAEAFARVLAENPRVLAVGETHPRQGVEAKSTAARFVDELMPLLDGRATDLVVELWVAKSGCAARQRAEVRAVASAQREVTQAQAPKNQSDFLRLYTAGRAHGEHVHLLVPPCDEYGKILDAGAGDMDAMLTMIANLSVTEIEKGLGAPDAGLVVACGGAMHNDLVPRPGMPNGRSDRGCRRSARAATWSSTSWCPRPCRTPKRGAPSLGIRIFTAASRARRPCFIASGKARSLLFFPRKRRGRAFLSGPFEKGPSASVVRAARARRRSEERAEPAFRR